MDNEYVRRVHLELEKKREARKRILRKVAYFVPITLVAGLLGAYVKIFPLVLAMGLHVVVVASMFLCALVRLKKEDDKEMDRVSNRTIALLVLPISTMWLTVFFTTGTASTFFIVAKEFFKNYILR